MIRIPSPAGLREASPQRFPSCHVCHISKPENGFDVDVSQTAARSAVSISVPRLDLQDPKTKPSQREEGAGGGGMTGNQLAALFSHQQS